MTHTTPPSLLLQTKENSNKTIISRTNDPIKIVIERIQPKHDPEEKKKKKLAIYLVPLGKTHTNIVDGVWCLLICGM